jgi:hypothetical protein
MRLPRLHPRTVLFALVSAAASIAACVCLPVAGADPEPPKEPEKKPATKVGTPVEVRFLDGSVLKLTVLEERFSVTTAYGKLVVPLAAVRTIDFATRVPADLAKQIDAAIVDLGGDDFKKREEAGERLFDFGIAAYPALLEAAKGTNKEAARRADDLIMKIRDLYSEAQLEVRKHDVVVTADSKFTGKIEVDTVKANTAQFGSVTLQLGLVRSLRNQGENDDAADAAIAQANPGNLSAFHDKMGKRLVFRVTGSTMGSIYGTDIYTTDSDLATAAVHAGVLKAGQTGLVRVRIVPPPPGDFPSTTRNGITSTAWGTYPVAYQIQKTP